MNVLGIVPARGGSKGIPNKNLRDLAGKPLLQYIADAARAANIIDRLILSTDSKAIADLGKELGLEAPFIRPANLAADDTPMLNVVVHALEFLEKAGWQADIVFVLQPTSPLRKAEHILEAFSRMQKEDCDSVVSVTEIPDLFSPQKAMRLQKGFLQFWDKDGQQITRRQEVEPAYAREGTVYAFWRRTLAEKGNIYGDKCLPLVLPAEESLSLDTVEDWQRAEGILSTKEKPRAIRL